MQTIDTHVSEVACLRQQIETQLLAMKQGLSGLSSGSARHAFINARMERIGVYQGRLADQLGERAADLLIYNIYSEIMDTAHV